MKLNLFSQQYNRPISLALGFFDCIHIGHRRLINRCNESPYETAVFTFSNDPASIFGGEKQIYNFAQRIKVLEDLGVELVISDTMNKKFASMEPEEFLDELFNNYNVKEINVGSDYTFGKDAKGDINILKEYCNKNGCDLRVHPFKKDENNNKISSRSLKSLVLDGNVDKLNKYLSEPYFVIGNVISCRHEGTVLGYPTANIEIPTTMLRLGQGVYATKIKIGDKTYNSMTNVGAKPTFNIVDYSIETFIFDFNQNIYNKDIKISFINKTRDTIKFNSENELKEQLYKDEIEIRKLLK